MRISTEPIFASGFLQSKYFGIITGLEGLILKKFYSKGKYAILCQLKIKQESLFF